MANFVCCLTLFLAVLALCILQGDATYYSNEKVEVSFKQREYTVKESAGRVAITIKAARRYYISFEIKIRASVKHHLISHARASSYDFEESIQTVRFSSKQSTATVYIKIKDDNRVEDTEAFQVEILMSRDTYLRQGVRYGDPSKAKVFIKDDDKVIVTKPPATRPPTTKPPVTRPPSNSISAQFSQQQYMVDESADYALLKVTVSGYRRFAISVDAKIFVSSRFQPKAASSYDVRTGVKKLIFNAGVNSLILKVRIYDDKLVEGTEAFGVKLIIPDHHVKNGVKLGNPSVATVFIKDDDKPATRPPTKPPTTYPPTTRRPTKPPTTHPPTRPSTKPPTTEAPTEPQMSVRVGFEFGRYKVKESCTLLPVTLVVNGEVIRPFTVGVYPMGFYMPSAIAGKDFVPDVQKVTFQPGQSHSSICIVIIDDDIREGTEKFRLLLSIPYSVRALGVWAQHPYYADVLITDDADDGRGLPVQSPPTDKERATMCICKPRPTLSPPTTPSPTTPSPTTPSPTTPTTPTTPSPSPLPGFTVMFSDSRYSGDEADGVIEVTIVATGVSSMSYTVIITPSELLTLSAREVFDYSNDTIVVTFNPGETNKTVLIVINPDCTREGSEFFNLTLSLGPAAMDLGVTLGDPSVAVAEIEDTDVIYVNSSQATYSAEEADGMMIITVDADGFSIWPYVVEINPIELLPVGGPGNAEGNGTDFVSDTLVALFNPGDSQVNVSLPIIMDQIFEPTERLSLTLTVPDEFSDLDGRLLIKPGSNDIAEGQIIDSNTLVTFSTDNYTALVNETSVEIRVIAIGPLDIEFRVQVVPDGTDLPEGVNQFFNPDIIEVFFPINVSIALLQIQLSPEQVGDMDLQFTVRLVVPAAAMSQGVVLGEPSLSTVTVPTPQ